MLAILFWKFQLPNGSNYLALYLKIGWCPFPSTTRCHLELLMYRCNNTCSRQNIWSIQKYFIGETLNSLFTLLIEYSGKLGEWTYQGVVEYMYCWIPGNHQLGLWQEGWCLQRKKELIRHVKIIPKDMEFVQSYHWRAETSITIATRINSSFYIDTTRPLPSSVGFGELSLSPMLSLYKLQ